MKLISLCCVGFKRSLWWAFCCPLLHPESRPTFHSLQLVYRRAACHFLSSSSVSLRWCVIVDIFFMAAVLFISWTSVTHRAWQWPSVQVDVSCVGYGLLHFSCFYLGDFFFLNHGGGILRMLPRIIYSIYTFVRAFSVSRDSSIDTHL